jgi:hypothetical protein
MSKAKIILPEEHTISSLRRAETSLTDLVEDAEILARTDNPHAIVEALVRISHAYQAVGALVERLEAIEREIRSETLPEIFGETTSNITTLGYRAAVSQQIRASIRATEKDNALTWLESNGHGSIIDREPRVSPQTLSAWAKTMIVDGEDLPEDLFSLFHFRNTSLTKATKK